jgi:hypothetical protein
LELVGDERRNPEEFPEISRKKGGLLNIHSGRSALPVVMEAYRRAILDFISIV